MEPKRAKIRWKASLVAINFAIFASSAAWFAIQPSFEAFIVLLASIAAILIHFGLRNNARQQAFDQAIATLLIIVCTTFILYLANSSNNNSQALPLLTSNTNETTLLGRIFWETNRYGGLLINRTLLKVYIKKGEYILVGSSAINVEGSPNDGDILIFPPGTVSGPIGQELIPFAPYDYDLPNSDNDYLVPTDYFSCSSQGIAKRNPNIGRISSFEQKIAGPDTISDEVTGRPGGQVPGAYIPCYFQASQDGIYSIAFLGPYGKDKDGFVTTSLPTFGSNQGVSVTAWDVTVRPDLMQSTTITGRVFTHYLAAASIEGTVFSGKEVYIVSKDGFIYKYVSVADDNGYLLYSNRFGFLNNDGTPLYRNILAAPSSPQKAQDLLTETLGGVELGLPENLIFFETPSREALDALQIPTFVAVRPGVFNFRLEGGDVVFETDGVRGVFGIVISFDGINFSPDEPQNRYIQGVVLESGLVRIPWDVRNSKGEIFPEGEYFAKITIPTPSSGEIHFLTLDVENDIDGTIIELINPLNGVCPPIEGGCFGAFFDDRGYRTSGGTLVGTGINLALCPNSAGNPPSLIGTDFRTGFDTRTKGRAYGGTTNQNGLTVCDKNAGFGDKKGLDTWTFSWTADTQIVKFRIDYNIPTSGYP